MRSNTPTHSKVTSTQKQAVKHEIKMSWGVCRPLPRAMLLLAALRSSPNPPFFPAPHTRKNSSRDRTGVPLRGAPSPLPHSPTRVNVFGTGASFQAWMSPTRTTPLLARWPSHHSRQSTWLTVTWGTQTDPQNTNPPQTISIASNMAYRSNFVCKI